MTSLRGDCDPVASSPLLLGERSITTFDPIHGNEPGPFRARHRGPDALCRAQPDDPWSASHGAVQLLRVQLLPSRATQVHGPIGSVAEIVIGVDVELLAAELINGNRSRVEAT